MVRADTDKKTINYPELQPLVQDTVVQMFFRLNNQTWQEQALICTIDLVMTILGNIQVKNQDKKEVNSQTIEKKIDKKDGMSSIYWLINFTPKNKT